MKLSNVMHTLSLAVVLAATGTAMAPQVARADASCTSLINSKYTYASLQQYPGAFIIEMTIHKDPLADVTYSFGHVTTWELWGQIVPGWLSGPANLQFSDRCSSGPCYQGSQNFNINAAEDLEILINPDGALWVWNNNYSYAIVDGTDMSCNGNLMSKYISGLGQVTLAFRSWYWLIH